MSPDRAPSSGSSEGSSEMRYRAGTGRSSGLASTTIRRSRTSTPVRTGGGRSRQVAVSSTTRTRRPTPAPALRRRNRNRLNDFSTVDDGRDDQDDEYSDEYVESPRSPTPPRSSNTTTTRQRQVNIRAGGRTARLNVSTQVDSRTALDGSQLNWYERLMPECILNMTAPLTGYEVELVEAHRRDLDDEQLEHLELLRFERNRKVRRRLLTLMLVAGAISVAFYMRGRVIRKTGVRAALGEMKHRIEDGLSKTLHDTMGK